MALARNLSTSHGHAEFKFVVNNALKDFPVDSLRKEQEDCLKNLVNRFWKEFEFQFTRSFNVRVALAQRTVYRLLMRSIWRIETMVLHELNHIY